MDFIDILRQWEKDTADPAIFENIDVLFPQYGFVRKGDQWASPLKLNLSKPLHPTKAKTLVTKMDMRFHEEGDWSDSAKGVIQKLMEDYNLSSVYEAYRFVSRQLGLDMPSPSAMWSLNGDRKRKLEILTKLEKYFAWNLANNKGVKCAKAKEYLQKRGFTQEWIERLNFGFVPAWDKVEAYITDQRFGYSPDEVKDVCNVRNEEGYTSVGSKHVLAIPYRSAGDIKGFIFRAVDPDVVPKYKAVTGLDRKNSFFNMPQDKEKKTIIVVEGELDALTATAAGVENVVAIGGSDITGDRKYQIYDALSRGMERMILCPDLDVDKEGRPNIDKRFKVVFNTLTTIFSSGIGFDEIYIMGFPYPCDPDEYIRKEGKDAFLALVNSAVPWWEYVDWNMKRIKSRVH